MVSVMVTVGTLEILIAFLCKKIDPEVLSRRFDSPLKIFILKSKLALPHLKNQKQQTLPFIFQAKKVQSSQECIGF